jgi:uncharacterized metal-binding protein YceD (DUF177 family)
MSGAARSSRIVDASAVPDDGVERHLEWNAEERSALAKEFDLLGIDSLAADVAIVPWRGDGFAVAGRVRAVITQSCVVSLVPVEQTIDEPFEVHFVREDSRLAAAIKPGRDIIVQVSDEEPPEVFSGRSIDVGSVVVEHLAVSIDPFPRAPGAEMPAEFRESERRTDKSESPFAVLEKLKNRDGR